MTTLAVTLRIDMEALQRSRRLPDDAGDFLTNAQIVADATVIAGDPDLDRAVADVVRASLHLDEVLHTRNERLAIERLFFAAKRLAALHRT